MPDDANLPARYADGRFGPGNPGRPVGSYNRAPRRAALAILDHFEKIQDQFLERLADDRSLYVALLSKVLPRQVEIGVSSIETASDAEVTRAIDAAHDRLDGQGDGHAALMELEAVLLGQTSSRRRADHR